MKRCPSCGTEYDDAIDFCFRDGSPLKAAGGSRAAFDDLPDAADLPEPASPPSRSSARSPARDRPSSRQPDRGRDQGARPASARGADRRPPPDPFGTDDDLFGDLGVSERSEDEFDDADELAAFMDDAPPTDPHGIDVSALAVEPIPPLTPPSEPERPRGRQAARLGPLDSSDSDSRPSPPAGLSGGFIDRGVDKGSVVDPFGGPKRTDPSNSDAYLQPLDEFGSSVPDPFDTNSALAAASGDVYVDDVDHPSGVGPARPAADDYDDPFGDDEDWDWDEEEDQDLIATVKAEPRDGRRRRGAAAPLPGRAGTTPDRGRPVWLWPAVIIVALLTLILISLSLGGDDKPEPDPAPVVKVDPPPVRPDPAPAPGTDVDPEPDPEAEPVSADPQPDPKPDPKPDPPPIADPVPPQPKAKGSLSVRSTPDGAEVFIDGTWAGRTPMARDLAPGSYEVRASRDGREQRRKARVTSGQAETLIFAFTQAETPDPPPPDPPPPDPPPADPPPGGAGQLSIYSYPTTGAQVFVDGNPKGTTPILKLSLPAGTHNVRVVKDGQVYTKTVNIEGGKETRTSFEIP